MNITGVSAESVGSTALVLCHSQELDSSGQWIYKKIWVHGGDLE